MATIPYPELIIGLLLYLIIIYINEAYLVVGNSTFVVVSLIQYLLTAKLGDSNLVACVCLSVCPSVHLLAGALLWVKEP